MRRDSTPTVSVFIPVFRESDLLESLLNRILADPYEGRKEVFVIIDEPTSGSLSLVKKFEGRVHFILNGERRGKVNVLNEAVNKAAGSILIFLDSDVEIDDCLGSFLSKIVREMEEADIVEVKKNVIRDSLLARAINYDYLGFNFVNWLFSKTLGRCLGFNGAAFAIKREVFFSLGGFRNVILEDMDLGTRSFMRGFKFKYIGDVSVHTRVPSSWREWFRQRKRWGVGAALWLKDYLRDLIKIVRKYPKLLLPSLLLIFPSLPLLFINLFIPDEIYIKIIYILLLVISTRASVLLPPIALTSTSISVIRNLLLTMSSLGSYSFIFYMMAQKLDFAFNPIDFVFFYLVYSPLWLLIMVASIMRGYLKPGWADLDWKV